MATTYCPKCGQAADQQDKFCRHCGTNLGRSAGLFSSARLSPQNAADLWQNFFSPFFKVAFIFFGCFFGLAFILMIFWYFTFRG
ncbi:MAG: zinc ribbon domain-containing protein [Desulfobacteraceae bacterium]|nr:zinc ribbon domain-containing protein [Desulfobacteraceae bacterium]